MKSFSLNGCSGRQERWALDGHRWVAAEPRRNGFDLWGYQDDTPEIVLLGRSAHEEQLEQQKKQQHRHHEAALHGLPQLLDHDGIEGVAHSFQYAERLHGLTDLAPVGVPP